MAECTRRASPETSVFSQKTLLFFTQLPVKQNHAVSISYKKPLSKSCFPSINVNPKAEKKMLFFTKNCVRNNKNLCDFSHTPLVPDFLSGKQNFFIPEKLYRFLHENLLFTSR
jgi:hypothetical protein